MIVNKKIEPIVSEAHISEDRDREVEILFKVGDTGKISKKDLYLLLARIWLDEGGTSYELDNAESFFDAIGECYKQVARAAEGKKEKPLQISITMTAIPEAYDNKDMSHETWGKQPWRSGKIVSTTEPSKQTIDDYVWLRILLQPLLVRSCLRTLAEVLSRHFEYAESEKKAGNKNWDYSDTLERCKQNANKLAHNDYPPFDAISLFAILQQRLCHRCLKKIPDDREIYCTDDCLTKSKIFRNRVKKGIRKGKRLPHIIDWLLDAQEEKLQKQ